MKYRPPRMPSDLDVTVIASGERRRAVICNVSLSGVLLKGLTGLSPGDRIDLATPGLRLRASVVRADADGVAARFSTPLSNAGVVQLRRAAGLARPRGHVGGAPMYREL